MIDEQKKIMRDLGVKLKEPPSPVKKPNLNSLNLGGIQKNDSIKNERVVKIYNLNEVHTYQNEGDKIFLFGPYE